MTAVSALRHPGNLPLFQAAFQDLFCILFLLGKEKHTFKGTRKRQTTSSGASVIHTAVQSTFFPLIAD